MIPTHPVHDQLPATSKQTYACVRHLWNWTKAISASHTAAVEYCRQPGRRRSEHEVKGPTSSLGVDTRLIPRLDVAWLRGDADGSRSGQKQVGRADTFHARVRVEAYV